MDKDLQEIMEKIYDIMLEMKAAKSEKRSWRDRALQVCITDLEKVYAYFGEYVIRGREGK